MGVGRHLAPVVVKLGGELVETDQILVSARALAAAARDVPLVVVHGGGREIDRLLSRVGIEKRMVDGVRVTDEATLEIVTAVLGGVINTRLVAAMAAEGTRAVGLTGADAALGPVVPSPPIVARDGRAVDLGLVGEPPPAGATPQLIVDLLAQGYVPVIASLGLYGGRVLNVNADTLAASLAARLSAARFVLAGAAPGVLDRTGVTIRELDPRDVRELVRSGVANGGMIAKLNACLPILDRVHDVRIAAGFDAHALQQSIVGSGGDVGDGVTVIRQTSAARAGAAPRYESSTCS